MRGSRIRAVPTTRLAIKRLALRSSRRRLRVLAVGLLASLLTHASAGASSLGPGDSQLASGEYFDRITFQGNAGDAVLIEITSSAFDPYLIVLDQADNVLFQEDDSQGFGLNVRVEYRLPATGSYTVVVTSARPGETGGYSLSLSAPDQAVAGPGKDVPAAGGTPPAQAPAQPGAGGAQGNAVQSQPQPAPQPRTVTGTVVDTQGRPISGARVWIRPALTTGLVEVRT